MVSSSQNIDNEIEVLRSKTIVKEVVEDLGLYISYTDEDEFLPETCIRLHLYK